MYILVTYDVSTEDAKGRRRLQHVAKLCKNYGLRVQSSVFECVLTEVQLIELRKKLEITMDTTTDSIRIYYLNKNESRRVVTLGKDTSVDVGETLIL